MPTSDFWPTLSLAERDRRWTLIRREMAARGLDVLIIAGDQGNWGGNFANVRYVTGIGDIGWALFPLQGEPIRFVWWTAPIEARLDPQTAELTRRMFEKQGKDQRTRNPWALAGNWITRIRQGGPRWSVELGKAIKDLGLERGAIGLVGTSQNWEPEGMFPATTYLNLRKELSHAQFAYDVTDIFDRARLTKSPEEITCLEKAAAIADRGIETMMEVAGAGVDEMEVYARIIQRMLVEGSERFVMLFWTCGRTPTHTRLFAPVNRPLQKGDVIIPELTPRYGGYVAHPHQPVSVGKPIPEIQEMFDLLKETRDNALAKLRPGVTQREQVEALTRRLEAAGYSYPHCPYHGLGLSGLEWPIAPFWGGTSPIEPTPLDMPFEEGMVFAYEPMISTPDRKIGLAIGDTVVVTRDGARRLGKGVDELIVV